MKQGKITNKEIRKYWVKVIRKSFEPVMKRVDMKLIFFGVMSLLFIVAIAGIGEIFGLVPIHIFKNQLSNFQSGMVTFWGSIVVALILFIALLYRTPAELERNQEQDFIKTIQRRNEELLQSRNEILKWAKKSQIPQPKDVAYEAALLVQEFETKFNAISNGEIKEMEEQYNSTRLVIDKLVDEKLPTIRLILKNAEVIQDNLYELNSIRNKYGITLHEFIDLKRKAHEYPSANSGFTPKEIRESMEKVLNLLWGIDEKSYKVQMNLVIGNLLKKLRETT